MAHPGRSREAKTRNRKALLSEPLGEPGHNRPNSSESFEHWERKAGRIQYEFRTRISNRGQYLASYHYNSSGYNQGPFNREFHKEKQEQEKRPPKEYSASTNNGIQHESHQE